MLQSFRTYIEKERLIDPHRPILLTVSGGIDSMVMASLFLKSGLKFSIGHCNFQLRESESNDDEAFIRNYAKENGIQLFVKHFDTQVYAHENKLSTQMAARDLRYQWFEELREEYNFSYIATAHHLDDQTETFLINLLRGTGIAGLHGILPKNGNIVRPILFATRKEIEDYAAENGIIYREDSSNASDKYQRNYIRHHITPELHHLNPNFSKSLNKTIERVRKVESIYKTTVINTIESMLDLQGEKIILDVDKLKTLDNIDAYLYEFLGLYNFNERHISDLLKSMEENKSGIQFYSHTHRIIKDRSKILLVPFEDALQPKSEFFEIRKDFSEVVQPLHLTFESFDKALDIEKNTSVGLFDADKLQFPLHIRRWREGDYFYPLGMKGKKKLSDFFIDNKISVYDKEDSWLLCSGQDIVWIIGHRTDDRFKITDTTQNTYRIEIINGNR